MYSRCKENIWLLYFTLTHDMSHYVLTFLQMYGIDFFQNQNEEKKFISYVF